MDLLVSLGKNDFCCLSLLKVVKGWVRVRARARVGFEVSRRLMSIDILS